MKLSFDQIKDEHERLKAEGSPLGQYSLADYSNLMQQNTPDADFSAGQSPDNFAGSLSRGIDTAFDATGLPALGSYVGGRAGALTDFVTGNENKYEAVGENIGRDLPRGIADTALVVGGFAVAAGTGGLAAPIGAGMIGLGTLDAGIKGYEASGGSVKQGLTDAVLTAAVPGIGKAGASVATRLVPKALAGNTAAKGVAAAVGSEAAFFASDVANAAINDQDPFSSENLFGSLLGTVAELPAIAKNTVSAVRQQKALNLYENNNFELTPLFSTGKEVKAGDGVQSVYDKNDIRQLSEWLLGRADAELPENFRGKNIEKALSLTGLKNPMSETGDLDEVMSRRVKGKELFQKATDPALERQELERLSLKVSKILETPPKETTDLILRVRALNDFSSRLKRDAEGSYPLAIRQPSVADAVAGDIASGNRIKELTMRNVTPKLQGNFPLAVRREQGTQPVTDYVNQLDETRRTPQLDENGALQMGNDLTQAQMMARLTPMPNRPQAVKGKLMPPPPVAKPPKLTAQDKLRKGLAGPDTPLPVKGKPRSIVPEPPLTPNSIDQQIQQKVKGKVVDPLAKYLAPELALVEPTGKDQNGEFTVDSLGQELNRLAELEGDVQGAVERLAQKVDNSLRRHVEAVTVGVKDDPLDLMSAALDNAGVHPELKKHWMSATERLRSVFGQDLNDVQFKPTSEIEQVNKPAVGEILRGAYFGKEKTVGLSLEAERGEGAMAGYDLLASLAHESTHALLHKIDENAQLGVDQSRVRAVKTAREYVTGISVEQRAQLLRIGHETLVPKGARKWQDSDSNINGWVDYASKSSDEFLTEYASLVALAKTSPANRMTFLRNLPEPLANFIKAVFRGIHELRQALFASGGLDKFRGGEKAFKDFHYNVESFFKPDPILEKAKSTVRQNTAQMSAMENGDIGGETIQYSKVGGSKVLSERAVELDKIKQSNGFVRNILQHAQLANSAFYKKHIPSYQKTMSALTTMDGLAVTLQHEMNADFMVSVDGGLLHYINGVRDKKLTPEQIAKRDVFNQVETTPKLQNALHDSMRKMNELVDAKAKLGELPPTWDDPEMQKVFEGFEPTEIAQVKQVYDAYAALTKKAGQLQIRVEDEKLVYVYADYIKGSGVPQDAAMTMARQLRSAQLTSAPLPPEMASNTGVQAALKHWSNVEVAYSDMLNSFDRPYFTEFRSGRYGVRYQVAQPDGTFKSGYRSTNDKLDLKAIVRELQADDKVTITNADIDHHRDKTDQFGHMKEAGLDKAIRLVRAHYEAAKAEGNTEVMALMESMQYDPAQPLVDTLRANQMTGAKRTFAEGREKINMSAAQTAYSGLTARKLANELTRLETSWQLKHEDWSKDTNLQEEMRKFRHGVLTAGRQEFQGFRKLTTFMTMGANVSSAIVDLTQMVTMGMWRALEEVGFAKAASYTAKAYMEAFKPIDKIGDADFKQILVNATNQGLLKSGSTLDNFIDPNDAMNYNVVQATDRRDMVDTKSLVTNREFLAHRAFEAISDAGQKAFDIGMTPTKLSSQINNKGSLYVGYRIGKDKGLTGSDLYRYAVSHMQTSNLQGGRAAHSSFKLKAGEGNKYVEAATLMTNYPIAMFAQMYSNFKSALKSSGLDQATRTRSAQAFAGQLLTQFGFAGIGGFGLNAVFKIAEEWFGVDVENEIRGSLQAIDESGTLGEVLLNGVMNQTTGYDLASRFDLTGVAGFNSFTGFEAKGLFGAGGGTISALYNAPSQFAKGDLSKIQLIPTGIRKLLDPEGQFTDSNNQRVIDPTSAERFANMVGFRPTRLTKAYEQNALSKATSFRMSEKKAQRKADLAQMMNEGNFKNVINTLNQEVQQELLDSGVVESNVQLLNKTKQKMLNRKLMELVDYTVNKNLPLDPMRQGSGETGRELSRVMENIGTAQTVERVSEEARVLEKGRLLQQLTGELPKNIPAAVRKARLVDQVIKQNPSMTRSQAMEKVESLLSQKGQFGS